MIATDQRAALDAASDRAADAAGGYTDRFLGVAGRVVRVRFAGAEVLGELGRAVRHLEVRPSSDPDLMIRVWSGPRPEGLDPDTSVRAVAGDGGFVESTPDSLHALHLTDRTAHVWVGAWNRPWPQRVAPLSPVLAAWLPSHGVVMAHAAAVGTAAGCVILAGGTGRGKSTAVAACLDGGLGCVGDDACLLTAGEPPSAMSIYDTVQIRDGHAAGISHLAERMPAAVVREAPVRALVIPGLAAGPGTALLAATPAEALSALGPTSILRLPLPAARVFERLARIAVTVPCHRLEIGRDREAIPQLLRALM